MSIVVVGGTGFIGRRLIPILEKQGEHTVCMDINSSAASFSEQVKVVRGDVTQFDEVMAVVSEAKPDWLINLSYYIGSDLPPRVATKLNVVGMDNCFAAARLCGVKHTVYASSLAVSGQQSHFGDRSATENDLKYGDN
jgi:nucleoside-diphosphate-sugar epimerase